MTPSSPAVRRTDDVPAKEIGRAHV
jgi:hypothetical protein